MCNKLEKEIPGMHKQVHRPLIYDQNNVEESIKHNSIKQSMKTVSYKLILVLNGLKLILVLLIREMIPSTQKENSKAAISNACGGDQTAGSLV